MRPVLEVNDLTAPGLHGISFSVGAGEVVGIAGVAGNGQTELLEAIVGMVPARGSLCIAGHEAASLDLDGRRALGLAHIAEDRFGMALIAEFSAEENLILADQRRGPFAQSWRALPAAITASARRLMQDYDVHPAGAQGGGRVSLGRQPAEARLRPRDGAPSTLSGGRPADPRRRYRLLRRKRWTNMCRGVAATASRNRSGRPSSTP